MYRVEAFCGGRVVESRDVPSYLAAAEQYARVRRVMERWGFQRVGEWARPYGVLDAWLQSLREAGGIGERVAQTGLFLIPRERARYLRVSAWYRSVDGRLALMIMREAGNA